MLARRWPRCPHCANEIDDGRAVLRRLRAADNADAPLPAPQRASRRPGRSRAPSRPLPPSAAATQRVPASAPRARRRARCTVPASGAASPARRVGAGAAAGRPAPAPGGRRPQRRRRFAAAQPLENLIGRTLNHRYLVEDKIGEGGFGAVFRGKQIATGREVALKILHPHNVSDETIVARFRREAEACSKLRDPHTVTTYDFDETPGRDPLPGDGAAARARACTSCRRPRGRCAPERVLRILDQVAASLAEAHANGIVHRDMKPENVFIEIARAARTTSRCSTSASPR